MTHARCPSGSFWKPDSIFRMHSATRSAVNFDSSTPPSSIMRTSVTSFAYTSGSEVATGTALCGVGIADATALMAAVPPPLRPQIEADCRYAGYIDRQQADIDALRRDEAITIPAELDYSLVGGLSAEARDVMRRLRPETIGQANRLPGLTPPAVVAVLRHLKRQQTVDQDGVGQAGVVQG